MIATLLLTIAYLSIWFLLTKLCSKYENAYSTTYFFGLGGLIYFVAIPLSLSINGQQSYLMQGWLVIPISFAQQKLIITLAILALSSFSLTLYFLNFYQQVAYSSLDRTPLRYQAVNKKIIRYFFIFSFIIAVIIFSLYHKQILAMIAYKDSYAIRYSNPLLAFLTMVLGAYLSALTAIFIRNDGVSNKAIGICIFLINFVFGFWLSSKIPILLASLGLLAGFFYRIKLKTLFLLTFIGIPVCLLLAGAFSLYRTPIPTKHYTPLTLIERASVTKADPAGSMSSISYYLNRPSQYQYGLSYLKSLELFVPKAILPNRYPGTSEEYAKKVLPNWQPGLGLSFSPLAEALLNFGLIGVIIQNILFAIIWYVIWLASKKIIFRGLQLGIYNIIYQIAGFITLFLSFRASLIETIKMLLMYLIPLLLVPFLALKINQLKEHIKKGQLKT